MSKKKLATLITTVAFASGTALSLVGCAGGNSTGGNTGNSKVESLNIAIVKDENTLTPFTYVTGTGLVVNRLIYDTLLTKDLNNEVIPWMVEDNYTVVDSKEFTFTLKDNLKFHNGNKVTTEDIKFSFEYPAKQNNSTYKKLSKEIENIDVIDDKTIKFTLKEPDINYLADGFAEMRILDHTVYEGQSDGSLVNDTVGSGPYKLVEYKTGEYYKLEAVDDYFKGTPKVKNINMPIMSDKSAIQQALISQNIAASTGDISVEMVDTFKSINDLEIFAGEGYAPVIININNGRAPFDNKNFRTALTYAIDVNGITKTLYGEYAAPGTKGAVRSDLPYAVSGLEYEYDPNKANQILDDLGYTEKDSNGIRKDKDGKSLSYEIITYSNNTSRTRLCELVKEQLKQVGINVEIKALDMDTADAYIWPDFDVSKGRDYDMSTWGWSKAIFPTYLVSLGSSDYVLGSYNVCGYKSEKFDNLISTRLDKVTSMDDMNELLKDLQKTFSEDNPLITVAYPDKIQVCNTKLYDGWKTGKGANVINIFSFLDIK